MQERNFVDELNDDNGDVDDLASRNFCDEQMPTTTLKIADSVAMTNP